MMQTARLNQTRNEITRWTSSYINFLLPDYLFEIEEYLRTTLQEETLTPSAQIRRRYLLDRFYALDLGATDGRNPLGWSGWCPHDDKGDDDNNDNNVSGDNNNA